MKNTHNSRPPHAGSSTLATPTAFRLKAALAKRLLPALLISAIPLALKADPPPQQARANQEPSSKMQAHSDRDDREADLLERIMWIQDNAGEALKIINELRSLAKTREVEDPMMILARSNHENAWGEILVSLTGIIHTELLLATTDYTQHQRDILAGHYAKVTMSAKSMLDTPTLGVLLQQGFDKQRLDMQVETVIEILTGLWARCELLSPQVAEAAEIEAGISDKGRKTIAESKAAALEASKKIRRKHKVEYETLKRKLLAK